MAGIEFRKGSLVVWSQKRIREAEERGFREIRRGLMWRFGNSWPLQVLKVIKVSRPKEGSGEGYLITVKDRGGKLYTCHSSFFKLANR